MKLSEKYVEKYKGTGFSIVTYTKICHLEGMLNILSRIKIGTVIHSIERNAPLYADNYHDEITEQLNIIAKQSFLT